MSAVGALLTRCESARTFVLVHALVLIVTASADLNLTHALNIFLQSPQVWVQTGPAGIGYLCLVLKPLQAGHGGFVEVPHTFPYAFGTPGCVGSSSQPKSHSSNAHSGTAV